MASITILDEHDLLSRPKPPMLVDGLLISGTVNELVSHPGVGKSFIALDIALSIAAGQPEFVGLPLRASGPVVYVLGEGAGRFGLRLRAWKQFHNVSRPLPFYWTDGPVNLLDEGNVNALIERFRSLRPSLLVFDTLSRCLVGAEENQQSEMTVALDHLRQIRDSVEGLTVLLLHHLNAAGTRERGSTTIRGGLDTQLRLKPSQKHHDRLLLTTDDKQRDLAKLREIALSKYQLDVAGEYEESGFPSRSLVLLRSDVPTPSNAESLSAPASLSIEQRVLEYIRENPGCSKRQVIKGVGAQAVGVTDSIDALIQEQLVTMKVDGQKHLLSVPSTVVLRPSHPTRFPTTPDGCVGAGNGDRERFSGNTVGSGGKRWGNGREAVTGTGSQRVSQPIARNGSGSGRLPPYSSRLCRVLTLTERQAERRALRAEYERQRLAEQGA